jgi:hypothetical protein
MSKTFYKNIFHSFSNNYPPAAVDAPIACREWDFILSFLS